MRVQVAYHRDTATWVAFAALFAFGILNAALGPVLPYLRRIEHTSYLVGALHQVAFAVGGMTAGIQASRSNAPRRRVIIVGLSGAAVAGLLLGYGRTFFLTIAAALLISTFATAALIRVWAVLADLHHRHRAVAMTEGEVAVSLAGIVTPAMVSTCAATALGWRFSFMIAFVLVAVATVGVAATRLPDSTQRHTTDTTEPHAAGHAGKHRHTHRRTLTTIFAVVGLEFTLSFWAASYLHDDIGIAQDTAAGLVSALYAANLAGRVLASRLARRLPPTTLLRLSLATALAGCPILLATDDPALATIGLAVTGIGIGGTFPLASSLHVAASGRTADQALGQILTIAGTGQITGPLVAGALAQAADLRIGLLVMPALIVLAAATTLPART
ncbi:MFS transporter [Actinoallomurus sp. NPDC050550]|uniref:MFS transporter n=1 Tax=Actinoallomurus sp. NPDC050550 TaxID=3154937 RepID=UPI0034028A51